MKVEDGFKGAKEVKQPLATRINFPIRVEPTDSTHDCYTVFDRYDHKVACIDTRWVDAFVEGVRDCAKFESTVNNLRTTVTELKSQLEGAQKREEALMAKLKCAEAELEAVKVERKFTESVAEEDGEVVNAGTPLEFKKSEIRELPWVTHGQKYGVEEYDYDNQIFDHDGECVIEADVDANLKKPDQRFIVTACNSYFAMRKIVDLVKKLQTPIFAELIAEYNNVVGAMLTTHKEKTEGKENA